MSWFRDSVSTFGRGTPMRPVPTPTKPAPSGSRVTVATSQVDSANRATEVSSPSGLQFGNQAMAYGNPGVGSGVVVMPNSNWYVSSADVYGSMDPSDPASLVTQNVIRDDDGNIIEIQKTPMWNYASNSKEEAIDAFNDDFIVSPMQKYLLEQYAQTIHPSKTGTGVWEDAVVASMSLSARGIYRTPHSIIGEWLEEWQKSAMAGGSNDSGGGGYYGGGGGFGGGGGGQINLMNEEDARAVVNSLSAQMLGRTVGEREFQQYFKSLRELQRANPSSVSVDESGNTVVEDPIGAEGLRYNLEEQMRNTEDFVTNSVGSQALGLLEQYLQSRSLGG